MTQAQPRLILGGASLGDDYKSSAEAQVLLGTAYWLGICEVDVTTFSPFIFLGASEKLLCASGAISKGIAINTKIPGVNNGAGPSLAPDRIRMQVEHSRKNLQLDDGQKINTLFCQCPDDVTPIKDQASTLNDLHEQGLFDKLGVCNWPLDALNSFVEVCDREGYVKPTVYQGRYNLLERQHETIMPALRKHGIRFDAHSPVAGGFLSGKMTAGDTMGTRVAKAGMIGLPHFWQYNKPEMHGAIRYLDELLLIPRKAFLEMVYGGIRYIEEMAKPDGMDMVEVAIRWIYHHSMLGPDDSIILGASKAHYLAANVEAIRKGPLPDRIVAGIDKLCDPASGINTEVFDNQGRVECDLWLGGHNRARNACDLWASAFNQARDTCNLWVTQQVD